MRGAGNVGAMSSSRPRVLHIVEATTAGVRRYVTALLRGMSANWDAGVACPSIRETHFGDVAFVEDVKQLGVTVHPLPLRRSIGPADIAAARALLSLLRRERIDLIHTHSSKAGFIGRLAARMLGLPAIHTPNGLYFLEQRGVKRWFYVSLERLAGLATSQLIAVSEGEREVIARYRLVARDRINLIENGVDADWLRRQAESIEADALRRSLAPGDERPLIGGVGRLAPQKAPLIFVQAAQRVMRVEPAARFVWCGDGELRDAMQHLARELRVPLVITGHLENVWAAMRLLSVFVLPSLYEGLPFTLLEAMALDIPVVATDVVGTRDVMRAEAVGRLAPPRDPDALARAIVETLEQRAETARRVQTARQLVETRFSMRRMLAAHHDLYSRVLVSSHT